MTTPRIPYSGYWSSHNLLDAPVLQTKTLRVCYPGSSDPALEAFTCCVPRGLRVALVGPNGAGKSTLLKAASGLLPAEGGDIRIYGQPVGSCRHCVAYVPQHSQIDWKFPICVRKLVLTGRYVHLGWCQRPRQHDQDMVMATLARLGLSSFAERQISQLSGGQQQRALLARALAQDADLFLLDEPLNAVDADTRKVIADVLHELQRQGKTFIVATHDISQLEKDFDSALYLEGGREVPPPKGAFVGVQVGQSA